LLWFIPLVVLGVGGVGGGCVCRVVVTVAFFFTLVLDRVHHWPPSTLVPSCFGIGCTCGMESVSAWGRHQLAACVLLQSLGPGSSSSQVHLLFRHSATAHDVLHGFLHACRLRLLLHQGASGSEDLVAAAQRFVLCCPSSWAGARHHGLGVMEVPSHTLAGCLLACRYADTHIATLTLELHKQGWATAAVLIETSGTAGRLVVEPAIGASAT
jgi:hypothetical protein